MQPWLDRLRREIEEATRGLSDDEWSSAPEGRWNSAQIVEHLGRTYGGTAKLVEKNLAAADNAANSGEGGVPGLQSMPPQSTSQAKLRSTPRPEARAVTMKERWLQFAVIGMGRFPSERRSPSFALPEGMHGAEALQKTLSGLQRMTTALDAAEQRWGKGQRIGAHVFFGPLTIAQWKKFHYLHGHHHVKQIWERSGKIGNSNLGWKVVPRSSDLV